MSFIQYTVCLSAETIAPIDRAEWSEASSAANVIAVALRSSILMTALRSPSGVYG